jgi:hypothetical protein
LIAKQNIKIDDKVLIKKLQKLNEDNAVGWSSLKFRIQI